MSQEHHLKLHTNYFDVVKRGEKNFEVRRDDRGFQKGDVLILHRYGEDTIINKSGYLKGRTLTSEMDSDTIYRRITYILTGGQHGIDPGHVVLGIAAMEGRR
jgi:hypothetical protein